MLNRIIVQGRCGRNPEKRMTAAGIPVTSVTLAVDRDISKDGNKETDWIDVVAWRETANFLARYFQKGSMVIVSGRLQLRDWTDKDGNKRRSAEIVADNVYFADSKTAADNGTNSPAPAPTQQAGGLVIPASTNNYAGNFAQLDDDEPLPF